MKAIETVYKGYRFRSRLEARWAVFFDALEIAWEYEKEGFNLEGTWYLPDFWLPQYNYWIEIKGQTPTSEEVEKCALLARAIYQSQSKKQVFLFAGSIPMPPQEAMNATGYRVDQFIDSPLKRKAERPLSRFPEIDCYTLDRIAWVECPHCGCFDLVHKRDFTGMRQCQCSIDDQIDFNGILDKILEFCPATHFSQPQDADKGYWWFEKINQFLQSDDSPRLIAAYTAARQARFEHRAEG